MTTNDMSGRDLSRWLREEGEHRVPAHLDEVLERTATMRQRPRWASLERWLPMQYKDYAFCIAQFVSSPSQQQLDRLKVKTKLLLDAYASATQ